MKLNINAKYRQSTDIMQKKPLAKIINKTTSELAEEMVKSGIGKWLLGVVAGAKKLFGDLHKFGNILKANFELGQKHYNLGNFEDAVLRFKFVIWLEPKHANGWYWLGISHLAAGQKPAGIKALQKAISLKPDLQVARDALAVAVVASGDNE